MTFNNVFAYTTDLEEQQRCFYTGFCRELAIESIGCKIPSSAKKITAVFMGTPSRYVQEICDSMNIGIQPLGETSEFDSKEKFIISGNDLMILPAWYWITLAMRTTTDRYDTFLELLEECERDSDLLYWLYDSSKPDAKNSITAWKLWLEKKESPTTFEMLKKQKCILELLGLEDYDEEDYEF
jgi:hypothetical protein